MTRQQTIDEAVTRNLEKYFRDLEGTSPTLIYDMVIRAVERPGKVALQRLSIDMPQAKLVERLAIAAPCGVGYQLDGFRCVAGFEQPPRADREGGWSDHVASYRRIGDKKRGPDKRPTLPFFDVKFDQNLATIPA